MQKWFCGSISVVALSASLGLLLGAPARAQAADAAAKGDDGGDHADIIVTAQKRAQNLQDVPLAVSAFSGDKLADAGAADLSQLQIISPSLSFTRSDTELFTPTIRIRGIGTSGNNVGLESAVGIFLDGVYLSRSGFGMGDLADLERVEVLRGPQGTLFGRNTSAGAINIVTKAPRFDFDYQVEATVTEYDGRIVRGTVTAPVIENLAAVRLTGGVNERGGVIENILGGAVNDRNRWFLRGQLLIEPAANLSTRIIVDYSDIDEKCCVSVPLIEGPAGARIRALGGQLAPAGGRKAAINDPIGNATTSFGISGEINWDIGGVKLTSITAYRDWEGQQRTDSDFTTLDFAGTDPALDARIDTFTQEIRLAGQAGALDWLIGAFYLKENVAMTQRLDFGSQFENYIGSLVGGVGVISAVTGLPVGSNFPEGPATRDDFTQKTEQFALFTHNSFKLTDRLTATLGVRFTDESKRATGEFAANVPACNPAAVASPLAGLLCLGFWSPLVPDFAPGTRISGQEMTGTFNLSQQWTSDLMTYVSVSRGYKGGGFNLERTAAVTTPFDPNAPGDPSFDGERATSFELGLRSTMADGRVTLNATAFYTDFADFQILNFDGLRFRTFNAEKARTKGVELEASARPTRGLNLNAGITYVDARFDKDNKPIPGLPRLAGGRVASAPKWAVTGGVSYDSNIAGTGLRAFGNANFRWQSGQYLGTGLDPEMLVGSYALVNARAGFGSADRRWTIEAFVSNLFDKDYSSLINHVPLQSGSFNRNPGDPRIAGLTLRLQH
ncbi:MAG: TonB-dependent receptor [Sphingopyxis sp.]|uniref:TonB-dependent receptor n=1 Tax=Sphingopyxis sp. TaxID=1908224 RepID=UPI002ABC4202|nr:TonB-dependent receptor [Sphingopyxis sp.]MDZ3833532.1 TonB-dependent receptor [Sphingopyxis sp.]